MLMKRLFPIGIPLILSLTITAAAAVAGASLGGLVWIVALGLIWVLVEWHRNRQSGMQEESQDQVDLMADVHRERYGLMLDLEGAHSNMVELMQSDLGQVNILISDAMQTLQGTFHGLNEQSNAQQEIVHTILERISKKGSVDGTAFENLADVSGVSGLAARTNVLVGDAVRSLQFEDIVTQLVAHIQKHLEQMDYTYASLHGYLAKDECIDDLDQDVRELRQIRKQIQEAELVRRGACKKSINQDSMTEGDIELFL